MTWQDAVIGAGQAAFCVALVPAMLSAEKPPRSTCAMTAGVLAAFAAAYASLGLWWARGVMPGLRCVLDRAVSAAARQAARSRRARMGTQHATHLPRVG